MITTIYLIRHSKTKPIEESFGDTLQAKNENIGLSEEGKELVKNLCSNNKFKNIDIIYSSHYNRALSTANIIAKENNIDLIVDNRLGERKHGVSNFNELPENYEIKQFTDLNFKVGDGECINEVQKRMYDSLNDILSSNKGKNIIILSHSTAILSLLKTWCEVEIPLKLNFNNKEFFKGNFKHCETFKLTFEEDNLISIENI